MRNSLYNHSIALEALPYATYTTGANNGSALDTFSFGNAFHDVMFVLVAEGSGDSGTHTFSIQESDASGSGYVAVDSFRLQGAAPVVNTDNDNAVHTFGCRPTKRYVRVVDTAASASSGLACSVTAILSDGSNNAPNRS